MANSSERSAPGDDDLPLGRASEYVQTYTPSLLRGIPRETMRSSLGLDATALPFRGRDDWTGYELSWLNRRGRPEAAAVRIQVPATTPRIVESKSLKLYLGSLSQTTFHSRMEVQRILETDLTLAARAPVIVDVISLDQLDAAGVRAPGGTCLDLLDVDADRYTPDPSLLRTEGEVNVRETLFTHLLRSLCPVTGQPDWATLSLRYAGPRIDHGQLLRYVVSFRMHQGFHEETVERMFVDLMARCRPTQLSIQARYLRRGGLEINPFRSTHEADPPTFRCGRQ